MAISIFQTNHSNCNFLLHIVYNSLRLGKKNINTICNVISHKTYRNINSFEITNNKIDGLEKSRVNFPLPNKNNGETYDCLNHFLSSFSASAAFFNLAPT